MSSLPKQRPAAPMNWSQSFRFLITLAAISFAVVTAFAIAFGPGGGP